MYSSHEDPEKWSIIKKENRSFQQSRLQCPVTAKLLLLLLCDRVLNMLILPLIQCNSHKGKIEPVSQSCKIQVFLVRDKGLKWIFYVYNVTENQEMLSKYVYLVMFQDLICSTRWDHGAGPETWLTISALAIKSASESPSDTAVP